MMTRFFPLTLAFLASTAGADAPEIIAAKATRSDLGWHFEVTLRHPDTDWDHFADKWEITDGFGNRLGARKLLHPHIDEQPFTRSLSGVMIPDGLRTVYARAHCSQDGWSKERVAIELIR